MRIDVDIKGTGSGGVGGSRVNWGSPGSVAAVPPFANLTVTNNKKTETKTVALFGHTHSINLLTELDAIANHFVPVHDIDSELPVWNLGSSTGFWHWLYVSAIKFRSVSTHQGGSDLEVLSGKLHTDKDFYSDGCVSAGGIGTTPSPSGSSVEWETVVADSYGTLTIDDGFDTPVNLSIFGHNHNDRYYTKTNTFTKQEVRDLIEGITGFEYVIVQARPVPSESTMYKIYLEPATYPATGNVYNEFITIRTGEDPYSYSWEQIGSTAIDLNGYVTKVDLYDSNNLIKFSKLPSLYIGSTPVQSSAQLQDITGIVSIYAQNLFAQYLKLDNSPSVDLGSEYFLRDRGTRIAINPGNSYSCPTKSLVYFGKYSSDDTYRAHWFYGNTSATNYDLLLSLGAFNRSFKNFIPGQNSSGTQGLDLGANENYWWRLFSRRWYPGGVNNAYIDYSYTTSAVTNHGNFISTGSVTAGALGTDSSHGEVSNNIIPTSSTLTIGSENGNKFQYIYATNIGNSAAKIANIHAVSANIISATVITLTVTGTAALNDSLHIDSLYQYLNSSSSEITDSDVTDILDDTEIIDNLLSGVYKAISCQSGTTEMKMSVAEISVSPSYADIVIYFGRHRRLRKYSGTWTYYNYWD